MFMYTAHIKTTYWKAWNEPDVGIAQSCFLIVYALVLTSNPHPKNPHTPPAYLLK